ncbi:hypothetical protein DYB32_006557 [Aphanomyces invadans]|uniref:Uncharacterized protein n=1 Tax=Aphanomyces invadans TaxID=157072 RepID=A0A418ARD4_9STRA|nr:hypothetical protein DYB32_006557 [Aphanomyces invadans]
MSSRGFSGLEMSPTKRQALLSAATSRIIDLHFTLVCGKGLLAVGADGLTSNCICEVSLVSTAQKSLASARSKLVKSTRNPLWNLIVEFGRVDLKDVDGIQVVVKHSAGFTSKPLGDAFIPVECFAENSAVDQDAWFPLMPTPDMPRAASYGDIRILIPAAASEKVAAVPINHSPVAELSAVKACHQAVPRPGQTWNVVAAPWVEAWLVCTTRNSDHRPWHMHGPIPNHFLLDSTANVPRVRANLRLIDAASWQLYHSWYGGGPTIQVQVPVGCPSISQWLAGLRLADPGVATIVPS